MEHRSGYQLVPLDELPAAAVQDPSGSAAPAPPARGPSGAPCCALRPEAPPASASRLRHMSREGSQQLAAADEGVWQDPPRGPPPPGAPAREEQLPRREPPLPRLLLPGAGAPPAGGRYHRRCRSMGASTHYAGAPGLAAAPPPAGWLPAQLPPDGAAGEAALAGSGASPGSDEPAARPRHQRRLSVDRPRSLAQEQQQPPQQQHQHAQQQQPQQQPQQQQQQQQQQHPQACQQAQQAQQADPHQPQQPQQHQRPFPRHQRSASVGWAPGGAGWWGAGSGASSPSLAALAAPPGFGGGPQQGGGVGSFLHLGGWGGALGALVAESLGGSRRGSLCLDASPLLSRQASGRGPSRAASSAGGLLPSCLICLDSVTPEDWESGEAMHQACACKGDVALRHRRCAVQWSLVKRSRVCDVCRRPITNLPEPPQDGGGGGGSSGGGGGAQGGDGDAWEGFALGEPTLRDAAGDAMRVMWMTLVVCLLFLGLPVARALVIGAAVGVAFTAAARALAVASRSAAAVHAFATALRERAWLRGQRRLQQQQQQQQQQQLSDSGWDDSPRAHTLPTVVELHAAPPLPAPVSPLSLSGHPGESASSSPRWGPSDEGGVVAAASGEPSGLALDASAGGGARPAAVGAGNGPMRRVRSMLAAPRAGAPPGLVDAVALTIAPQPEP